MAEKDVLQTQKSLQNRQEKSQTETVLRNIGTIGGGKMLSCSNVQTENHQVRNTKRRDDFMD